MNGPTAAVTWIAEPASEAALPGGFRLSRDVRVAVITLGLVALVLYAPLIGWGLPYATAPDRIKTFATDEIVPLEGLAEMRSTFVSAAPDRNLGYPWWHYFVVSVAQAPYLAALWLTGNLSDATSVYPFGLRDPVTSLQILTIIGRCVSVLMGVGVVIASFFFAKALWGNRAGAAAGLLTSVSYPMAYYSRTGNLDVPALFWSAVALAILATMWAQGVTIGRAAWFAAFAALGVATKEQAVALVLPACVVMTLPRFTRRTGQPHSWTPLVVALLVGLGVYLVATGMLFDPTRHIAHLYALVFDRNRLSRAAAYFPPAPSTWSGFVTIAGQALAGLSAMMSLPVLVAAAAGLTIAMRRSAWQLIWLMPFVATFVLFIWLPGIVVLRYLLPMTLVVDAFAAFALVNLRTTRFRMAFMPLLVGLVGLRLLAVLDLSYAQRHDTRYPAADWVRAHYRTGDRLEYFGGTETLPPLDAAVDTRRIMGRERWVGETGHGPAVLDYLRRGGPTYVIVIPDWTSRPELPHSADCPPEVYAALLDGTAGYSLAAYFAPPSLWPAPFGRPLLDNPSVAPPVRIFARTVPAGASASSVAHTTSGAAEAGSR
jgi:hypothetical protein